MINLTVFDYETPIPAIPTLVPPKSMWRDFSFVDCLSSTFFFFRKDLAGKERPGYNLVSRPSKVVRQRPAYYFLRTQREILLAAAITICAPGGRASWSWLLLSLHATADSPVHGYLPDAAENYAGRCFAPNNLPLCTQFQGEKLATIQPIASTHTMVHEKEAFTLRYTQPCASITALPAKWVDSQKRT